MEVLIEGPPPFREDGDWEVCRYQPGLPNSHGAAVALVFDGRVPPSAKMDDVVCAGERQADPSGLRRQYHDIEAIGALLEGVNPGLPHRARDLPIYYQRQGRHPISAL